MDVPMTIILCPGCGALFAIPNDLVTKLRECHNTFYCPNGHSMSYEKKTKSERAIADLHKTVREKSETIELLKKAEAERLRKAESERLAKLAHRKKSRTKK